MSTVPGRDDSHSPIHLHRRRLRLASPPAPLTPLLGREREVALAVDLLARGETRLVTLIGPGGIGKTRLALGIASALAPAFEGQVAWAPVVTATTPDAVASALAQAVGIVETGPTPTIEALKNALRDVRLLLVVDNFEQVLDAAPVLTDLLQSCPAVSILVTSRAVLRVVGERALEAPPLATAPAPGSGAPGDVAPAVELFAQRATSVAPSFALTPGTIPVVAEICRRLDGLPLAIELAAARANALPLRDLRDRLDSRLALLTGGARDMPARQRTMRDAIAWSYDLLTADQRALFRSLAVFAGGFTLDAAEAVAGKVAVLDLGVLVDNSLVRLEPSPQDGARYAMLETVREFAVEQLHAAGDESPWRRHAGFFLEVARRVLRAFWGDEPGDVRGQVRAEEANLRAAVSWAIDNGEVDMALQLALVMFDPLSYTGDNAREQLMWLRRALDLPGGSPAARAFALARSAGLGWIDEPDKGTALAERGLELARQHDDAFGTAECLRVLGNILIHTGEHDRARRYLLDALAGFRELGMRGRAGWTLHHLSALEGLGPEATPELAAAYCDEALTIFRELGHVRGIEATLNWHSEWAFNLGNLPVALASAQEGLAMLGSDTWSFDYLDRIADVAGANGQTETAARLYGAAFERRLRAGRPIEPAFRTAHDARVAALRSALGEEAFAAATAAGRTLTQQQVEAEALAVTIQPAAALTVSLSPRESEVLRLIAAGYTDRAIAESLFIGERTVNTHVARLYAKLGVRNRAAAVATAAAAGLIDPSAGGTDTA